MKKALFSCTACILLLLRATAADTTVVTSPDGTIQFRLFQKDGQFHFSVARKREQIIAPSPLSMTVNGSEILKGTPGKPASYKVNERYPWMGVHSTAINHCNGLQLPVNNSVAPFTLDIRVYNHGAAFRITLNSEMKDAVPDEATIFNIPKGSIIWYHDLEMHYESVHAKKDISAVPAGDWVAPPATFKLPGGSYASITEADLKDYSGMSLQSNGNNGLVVRLAHHHPTSYPYRLRYSPEDTLRLRQPASISGRIITPWRVVIIGADLNELVNADIVHNLCPAPDPKLFPKGLNTDWIRPGRAVWKYLDGGGPGTIEVMQHFSDQAAKLGFEHNILEGFWSRWSDDSIRYLVNYSKKLGVDIWLWKHSKSLRDPKSRDSFFRKCHELGVVGAKIDFFDHEAKEVIDLYESILREAAHYKLLLDFHGANKPTGRLRTWPNELTREAVRGMEARRLDDRATHETTLPFTHFLAGPAEYTVVHFGERRKNTTWAHQIASAAILSTPLLTYGANPDSLLANPAVDVIKKIPANWDETIVLPGSEIGELAAFARRKGKTWFIAVMNGTQPRNLKIPLTFLKQGKFRAVSVNDDPANAASVIVKEIVYSAGDVIELNLVSGGGCIVMINNQ
ncbi:MAG TPA: glycoside hydrolase family 97 N-terminal domain-containing protein [Chitinophagaceae bacterium]